MAYNPANKDVPCSAYPYKGSIFKLTGAVAGWDELIWPGSARDFFTINHADRGEQWITNCDTGEIAFREWKQGTGWGAVKVFAKGLDLSGFIKTDGTSTATAAIPFAKGVDITGTDASGWALRIPSTSWIGTSSPDGTLYITSGTTPGNGSRIFLQPDSLVMYGGSGGFYSQLYLGSGASGSSYLGNSSRLSESSRTYWNPGNIQHIVGEVADASTTAGFSSVQVFNKLISLTSNSFYGNAGIWVSAEENGHNQYNAVTSHKFNAPIYTVANQPGIVLNGDPYTGTKPNAYLIGTDGYTQVLHNSATTTAQLTLADNFASINWVSDTNKTTNVRASSSGIYLQWQDLPTPPVGTQAYLLGIDATGAIIRGTSTTTPNIDYVQFNNAATPSYVEGRVYYNHTDHTLNVMTQFSGVTLQVGEELQKQARNNTGSTIADGTVVYVSGATGGVPTIGLADSGNVNTIRRTIGLATHSIGNNTVGRVTTNGAVRDLNTSAFNDGDILYLSTAGGITNVRPTTGLPLQIGVCAYAHPTQGVIDVDPRYDLFGSVMLLNGHNDLALPFSFGDGTTWANSNYGMVIDGSLTHSLWMKGNVRIEQSTTEAISLFKPTAIAGQEVCMTYEMWDTLGGDAEYARTCGEIVSSTAGAYSGRLNFYTASGGALVKRGYFSETGALVLNGALNGTSANFSSTTASTSTTTGALVVAGGIGAGGRVTAPQFRDGSGMAAILNGEEPSYFAGGLTYPAYNIYAQDGTKNIRSSYGINVSTGYVVTNVTAGSGLNGYAWQYTNANRMTLSIGGELTITGRMVCPTVTATATGEPINIGSGTGTTSPSTNNAGAMWMNATNGLQFCSTAGTARTVATLDTAQTFNSVKTFSSTPVISSTTVSTTAGALYKRTNYGLVGYEAGHAQEFLSTIYTGNSAASLTNNAAATDVGGTALFGSRTLSTSVFQVGQRLKYRAKVQYTNTAANTLTLELRWGSTSGAVLATITSTRVNAGVEVFDVDFEGIALAAPGATVSTAWTANVSGNTAVQRDTAVTTTPTSQSLATSTATALVLTAKWSTALTTSTLTVLSNEINLE